MRGAKARKTDGVKPEPVSPERSVSSTVTESTSMASAAAEHGGSSGNSAGSSVTVKEESFTSASESEEFKIDESFWSETLSMPLDDINDVVSMEPHETFGGKSSDGDMDYWLRVFMEGGAGDDDVLDLPQI
jgi:myb proto-oncogene protein